MRITPRVRRAKRDRRERVDVARSEVRQTRKDTKRRYRTHEAVEAIEAVGPVGPAGPVDRPAPCPRSRCSGLDEHIVIIKVGLVESELAFQYPWSACATTLRRAPSVALPLRIQSYILESNRSRYRCSSGPVPAPVSAPPFLTFLTFRTFRTFRASSIIATWSVSPLATSLLLLW